jgi:hypothetical protein
MGGSVMSLLMQTYRILSPSPFNCPFHFLRNNFD